jgi:hypothetical protein
MLGESGYQSIAIEIVGFFNVGGHQGREATEALSGTGDFIILSGSSVLDILATNMPDDQCLSALYSVKIEKSGVE